LGLGSFSAYFQAETPLPEICDSERSHPSVESGAVERVFEPPTVASVEVV
jgi:hypothetical protein